MRVLVCGGRNFTDEGAVFAALDHLDKSQRIATIIHGGARGTDKIADRWAWRRHRGCEEYPAQWKYHGKAAGPIRNQHMLEAKPDIVLAFPGGRGTADMVARAKGGGLKVVEYRSARA